MGCGGQDPGADAEPGANTLAMMIALMAAVSTAAAATPPGPSVSVDFATNAGGLTGGVSVGGVLWWAHQRTTPLREGGAVRSQGGDGPSALRLAGPATRAEGSDAFGAFQRVAIQWATEGSDRPSRSTAPLVPLLETACRTYPAEGLAVFEATALSPWSQTNGSRPDGASPLMQFPGLDLFGGAARRASYSMWYGLWPLPAVGLAAAIGNASNWQRRHDGPVMLTAPDRTAVVVGPVNDTLNIVYARSGPNTVSFGPSGALASVPRGRTFQVMVASGSGPTAALRRYGELLLLASTGARAPPTRLRDPFVENVTLWTDNGAFYFWNAAGRATLPPPGVALPAALRALRGGGVGVGGLQLDGWWMQQTTLAPDATLFSGTAWPEFRRAIGADTPLLLYKAFFAEKYDLFANFSSVQSPTGAWYPAAGDAKAFFLALFRQGLELGMTSYETDFMSDHWLTTPALAGDVDGLATYLDGLAQAGAELNVPMQWCMPTAGIALHAARLPAVSNLRVSVDYACEGPAGYNTTWPANFAVGIGSLLFASLGVVPSKDLLWTRPSQPGMFAVCGGVHDQPNVELDMALAVLSTGPVGLGDRANNTNLTLAAACCRADGVVLKPSRPLAAMDALFVPSGKSPGNHVGFLPKASEADGDCTASRPCSPAAHQTHSVVPLLPAYASAAGLLGAVTYYHVLTINLGPFRPSLDDFDPPFAAGAAVAPHFWREWRWSRACAEGAGVGGGVGVGVGGGGGGGGACGFWVGAVGADTPLPDISSGSRLLGPGGAIAWRLFTLSPSLPFRNASGGEQRWVLLGELDKVVHAAAARFADVHVTVGEAAPPPTHGAPPAAEPCVGFRMNGAAGETVRVSAVTPRGALITSGFDGAACPRGGAGPPCRLCAPKVPA